MNRFLIIVLTGLIITSCSGSYYAKAGLNRHFTQEQTLGACASVILKEGYIVKLAVGSIGVLNTDWKEERRNNCIQRTKIHFLYDETKNSLKMIPFIEKKLQNGKWKKINTNRRDMHFNKIFERIIKKLKNKVKIIWLKEGSLG